jgi:hypothetical protein
MLRRKTEPDTHNVNSLSVAMAAVDAIGKVRDDQVCSVNQN